MRPPAKPAKLFTRARKISRLLEQLFPQAQNLIRANNKRAGMPPAHLQNLQLCKQIRDIPRPRTLNLQ